MAKILVLGSFLAFCTFSVLSDGETGIRLRITKKGLKYVMDSGMQILQSDLQGKNLNIQSGRFGKFHFEAKRAVVDHFQVGNYHLSPLPNVGVKASIGGIKLKVSVDLKVWFRILFKQTMHFGVTAETEGANFRMNIALGKGKDDRPVLSLPLCESDIGGLKVRFSNSGVGGLLNFLAKFFKGAIKKKLNRMICKALGREINKKANEKLAKNKIIKKIDKWAIADYGLASTPVFTKDYMDIHLKGYFKSTSAEFKSSLSPPSLPSTAESGKMIHCWLSDYLFNTAGEIYHKSGILRAEMAHDIAPGMIKPFLSTNPMKIYVPGLYKDYPNHTLKVVIKSSKAPTLLMRPGDVTLAIHASLDFEVQTKSGPIPVFGYSLEIFLKGMLWVANNFLHSHVTDARVDPMVRFSKVGKINFSMNILRTFIQRMIVEKLKVKFKTGLALPSVKEVELVDTKVELHQGYMLLESDLKYVPSNNV